MKMPGCGKGWFFDSKPHGLAAKGIRTVFPDKVKEPRFLSMGKKFHTKDFLVKHKQIDLPETMQPLDKTRMPFYQRWNAPSKPREISPIGKALSKEPLYIFKKGAGIVGGVEKAIERSAEEQARKREMQEREEKSAEKEESRKEKEELQKELLKQRLEKGKEKTEEKEEEPSEEEKKVQEEEAQKNKLVEEEKQKKEAEKKQLENDLSFWKNRLSYLKGKPIGEGFSEQQKQGDVSFAEKKISEIQSDLSGV